MTIQRPSLKNFGYEPFSPKMTKLGTSAVDFVATCNIQFAYLLAKFSRTKKWPLTDFKSNYCNTCCPYVL